MSNALTGNARSDITLMIPNTKKKEIQRNERNGLDGKKAAGNKTKKKAAGDGERRKREAGVVGTGRERWRCSERERKEESYCREVIPFGDERHRWRVISKGNIITFSYLLLEHSRGGRGRKEKGKEEGRGWRGI